MSKVSTFVQGDDFKFYKNPVLYGDDWYLCFDDDDPPEVVIKATVKRTAKKLAGDRLAGAGVCFKWGEPSYSYSSRLFPPTYTGFQKAFGYFVQLTAPLPVTGPASLKHDGAVDFPSVECTFLTFFLDFDAADVAKLFGDKEPSVHLMTFLGVGKDTLEDSRKRLRRMVKKQLLGLREAKKVTEDVIRQVCGDRPRLRRLS